jgi:gluconolactonase
MRSNRNPKIWVAAIVAGMIVSLSTWIGGSASLATETLGEIERLEPAMDQLLDEDAQIEILARGFTWTEGPVWMPEVQGGSLLFSDIPRNTVFQWREGQGIRLFLQPSGYTGRAFYGLEPGSNGLLLDPQGRLVLCEHGDRRIAVLTEDGGKRTLVDNYQGKRLNSPNDAVYRSNGDLYFTDPPYGLPNGWDDSRRELDFCGVYRLTSDGKLTLLTDQLPRPNGIALSPDEKTLYVAQSDPKAAIWMAFPIQEEGTLGAGRVLFDATKWVGRRPGLPDGLAVDQGGNLWASGPGGILILSPEGRWLGRLNTGQRTSNCTFGEDGKTLFITADSFLCRVRTRATGIGF